MSKKETIKITQDGLNFITVLNFSSIGEINGFYGKEVYFTDGFTSEISCLFQALGNVGAFARNKNLDNDINCIIISNEIITNSNSDLFSLFKSDFENKLNQNNSPYRRIKLFSENHLIWYMENRAKLSNDQNLISLIKRYKSSMTPLKQPTLF